MPERRRCWSAERQAVSLIAVLTGPVRSGKTSFLLRAVSRWRGLGRPVTGYLSRSVESVRGAEYFLLDLQSGREFLFLTRTWMAGAEHVGPYFFVPGTLDMARSIMSSAGPDEVLVVDEAGPLELEGGGISEALEAALAVPGAKVLVTVREGILEGFISRIGERRRLVVDVRDPQAMDLMEKALFGPSDDGD